MTTQEVLNDQARKYEEARRIFIENDKTLTEIERMHAEIGRIQAEIGKMVSETLKNQKEGDKLQTETKWYPFVVGAGIFGAAATFTKFFL